MDLSPVDVNTATTEMTAEQPLEKKKFIPHLYMDGLCIYPMTGPHMPHLQKFSPFSFNFRIISLEGLNEKSKDFFKGLPLPIFIPKFKLSTSIVPHESNPLAHSTLQIGALSG